MAARAMRTIRWQQCLLQPTDVDCQHYEPSIWNHGAEDDWYVQFRAKLWC